MELLFPLADHLSVYEATKLAKDYNSFASDHITRLYIVKSIRNAAVHGDLPVLDQWDPDNPRPKEQRRSMLFGEAFEFPEGYRVIPKIVFKLGPDDWCQFDLRKYK